jgi:hypothetical protein
MVVELHHPAGLALEHDGHAPSEVGRVDRHVLLAVRGYQAVGTAPGAGGKIGGMGAGGQGGGEGRARPANQRISPSPHTRPK